MHAADVAEVKNKGRSEDEKNMEEVSDKRKYDRGSHLFISYDIFYNTGDSEYGILFL